MRYIKLESINFKPYYDKAEIRLFDKEYAEKTMTLNIGANGRGKTTISEMIFWCLFGGKCYIGENWFKWINDLSIEIAKQYKKDNIKMEVKLTIELNDEEYTIVRIGKYDLVKLKPVDLTELVIIKEGKPVKNPDQFIADNFLTVSLMEYFIFDADHLLDLFEKNQKETISQIINKILHVEVLDKMINIFSGLRTSLDSNILKIKSKISGNSSNSIKTLNDAVELKREAIVKCEEEIETIKEKQKELFTSSPTPEVKTFNNLVEKRDKLNDDIKELNKEFREKIIDNKNIISQFFLLFLDEINEKAIVLMKESKVSKNEFLTSIELLKSSLGDNYIGIIFDEKEIPKLIKDSLKVKPESLDEVKNLKFSEKKSNVIDQFNLFVEYKNKSETTVSGFTDSYKLYKEKESELLNIKNQIRQLGETKESEELNEKYKDFQIKEKRITTIEDRIDVLNGEIDNLIEEINEKDKQLDLDKDQKQKIDEINKTVEKIDRMNRIVSKTKSAYMENLLKTLNKDASDFLRRIVHDNNRFHSIEVLDDYTFEIKDISGSVLDKYQINKGSLQIALMSFFFALSNHFEKNLPYIIDAPLIRLDPGHDRRLLENLARSGKQIIMHVIPGKEYTSDSFKWLSPFINTQNWINRKLNYKLDKSISLVEKRDVSKMVNYEPENL